MSRNNPGKAAPFTVQQMKQNPYNSSYSKTYQSTKAASQSRVGALPSIAQHSASRQQFLKNARAGNSQSALSLYKDTEETDKQKDEYPFASGVAKRKLMRLQHLMKTGQDMYTKTDAKNNGGGIGEPNKTTHSDFSLNGAIKDLQNSLDNPVYYTATK